MTFQDILQSPKLITLDGAMGTELDKRGSFGRCENNLTNPESVILVHKDYIKAGSTAIITNTLTMNRIFIETHKLNIDVTKVNLAGVRLAREAIK
jgi:methionine synthase I (cobalamin-dependent)